MITNIGTDQEMDTEQLRAKAHLPTPQPRCDRPLHTATCPFMYIYIRSVTCRSVLSGDTLLDHSDKGLDLFKCGAGRHSRATGMHTEHTLICIPHKAAKDTAAPP